jgi:hypothetical protein
MTPARTATFAIAAGLAVGNLYLAQPLIRVIAHAFGVGQSSAAVLVIVVGAAGRNWRNRSNADVSSARSPPS